MTNKAIYPYTQRNLIDHPEYYMFSAYHGADFLYEYFEQRATFVADLEQYYIEKLIKQNQSTTLWLLNWKDFLEQNDNLFPKDIKTNHARLMPSSDQEQPTLYVQSIAELDSATRIDTQVTLRLLLQIAVEQNQLNRDGYLFWLNRFLKRFEVSKKLYSAYQPSMKFASNNYHSYLNYALLSLVSLCDYEWAGNLKMLNTALKLNDLLCSQKNELKEPELLLVTMLAIHKERLLIRQIMTNKEVVL